MCENIIKGHKVLLQKNVIYFLQENRMHPFMTASKSVKNRAYSVGNASGNKEDNAICAHNFNGRFYENNNNPSHGKVANHRKYAVFL